MGIGSIQMNVPVPLKLFVGGLSPETNAINLGQLFELIGPVKNAQIITEDGRSKGYAYVEMFDDNKAQQALQELNGAELNGRRIHVDLSNESKTRLAQQNRSLSHPLLLSTSNRSGRLPQRTPPYYTREHAPSRHALDNSDAPSPFDSISSRRASRRTSERGRPQDRSTDQPHNPQSALAEYRPAPSQTDLTRARRPRDSTRRPGRQPRPEEEEGRREGAPRRRPRGRRGDSRRGTAQQPDVNQFIRTLSQLFTNANGFAFPQQLPQDQTQRRRRRSTRGGGCGEGERGRERNDQPAGGNSTFHYTPSIGPNARGVPANPVADLLLPFLSQAAAGSSRIPLLLPFTSTYTPRGGNRGGAGRSPNNNNNGPNTSSLLALPAPQQRGRRRGGRNGNRTGAQDDQSQQSQAQTSPMGRRGPRRAEQNERGLSQQQQTEGEEGANGSRPRRRGGRRGREEAPREAGGERRTGRGRRMRRGGRRGGEEEERDGGEERRRRRPRRADEPHTPSTTIIFLATLAPQTTSEDLSAAFQKYHVKQVAVTHRSSRVGRTAYGYVELDSEDERKRVLDEMPTVTINDVTSPTAAGYIEPARRAFTNAAARARFTHHPAAASTNPPSQTDGAPANNTNTNDAVPPNSVPADAPPSNEQQDALHN